jgi:hypothetical protein
MTALNCAVPGCGDELLGPHYEGMARLCGAHQLPVGHAALDTKDPVVIEMAAVEAERRQEQELTVKEDARLKSFAMEVTVVLDVRAPRHGLALKRAADIVTRQGFRVTKVVAREQE